MKNAQQILGFDPLNCSPEKTTEVLRKQMEELGEETTRTVERLASNGWGSFIKQGLGLLQALIGGTAAALMRAVSEQILAPLLRTITSIIGGIFALVPAFKLVLLYLAAKELKLSLEQRIQFQEALRQDLTFIARALANIILTSQSVNAKSEQSLRQANRVLRQAALKIGREISKQEGNFTTSRPVDERQLAEASELIRDAIDYLSYGASEAFTQIFPQIQEVNVEFGVRGVTIKTSATQLPIKDVIDQIIKNSSQAGDRAGEYLLRIAQLSRFGPYFQALVSIHGLYPVYKRVGEKLPSAALLTRYIPQLIGDSNSEQIAQVYLFLGGDQVPNTRYPQKTYAQLCGEVRLKEAVLSSLNEFYSQVQTKYGAVSKWLLPANKIVLEVADDIKGHLDRKQTSLFETGPKRLAWTIQLEQAKQMVDFSRPSIINISIDGQEIPINTYQIQRVAAEAFKRQEDLTQYILQKYQPREPSSRVLTIGQTWFNLAIASPALLFGKIVKEDYRQGYLANLASMQFSNLRQNILDKAELIQCNQLITEIERIPGFQQLYQIYQDQVLALLKGVGDQDVFGLSTGDISAIAVGAIGLTGSVKELIEASKCKLDADPPAMQAVEAIVSRVGEVERDLKQSMKLYEQQVAKDMSYLKNKKLLLETLKDLTI